MPESLPPKGGFFDDNLQNLYEDSIDQLISDLGYVITLYLPPTEEECPNCGVGFDLRSDGVYNTSNPNPTSDPKNQYFPAGATCPVCRGSHALLTEDSVEYTALIKYTPNEWEMGETGIDKTEVVRLKTRIEALEEIKIAKMAKIEGSLYKLISDPVKTGLQVRTYLKSFWQRIEG
jgi:hypothetical protein